MSFAICEGGAAGTTVRLYNYNSRAAATGVSQSGVNASDRPRRGVGECARSEARSKAQVAVYLRRWPAPPIGWRCSSAESDRESSDPLTAALLSNANAKIREVLTVPLDDGGGVHQHH